MSTLAPPATVSRLAVRQHGIVSGAQLRDLGLSRAQIRYRVGQGALLPRYGDTYALPGTAPSPLSEIASATLATPGSVATELSAASVVRLPGRWDSTPTVAVRTGVHHRVPGVVVRRTTDLLPRQRTIHQGIPVTTIPRTVIDLAGVLEADLFEQFLDRLLNERILGIERLSDEFDRIARRGRTGTAALRRMLVPRLDGLIVPRTELESRGHAFLERYGLGGGTEQYRPSWASPVITSVDVAFVDSRVIVEFDGRRWHDRDDRFEGDRVRDQIATEHGWLTFRITWQQLKFDPSGTARRLRGTLLQRTPARKREIFVPSRRGSALLSE